MSNDLLTFNLLFIIQINVGAVATEVEKKKTEMKWKSTEWSAVSGERRRRFLNYQTATEKTHHSKKYRLFVCLQEFKYYYKPTLYL